MTESYELSNILESYNLAIQRKFEDEMHKVQTPSDYNALMDEARSQWERIPIGGRLPSEIFGAIREEDLTDIFRTAALVCDDFIPGSLASRILDRVNIDTIVRWTSAKEQVEIRTAAVMLLGMSKDSACSDVLMDLLYDEGEYADLMAEKARDALVTLGTEAIQHIKRRVDGIKKPKGNDFHLIIALVQIDSNAESDEVYSILRKAFRDTDEKALAARCLADYGNVRAVSLLRSYLASGKGNPDEIQEIQGSILNLGGNLEGL